MLRAYTLERGLFNTTSHRTKRQHNWQGRAENWRSPSRGKNEAKRNNCVLYETADTSCKNFIMEVVNETWYKEPEDSDTFFTDITALKLFDYLTKLCSGLRTIDAVDIPQMMKTLFSDAKEIPKYINAMEAVQQKSKRAKLIIHDEYTHSVALKLLLQ